MPDGIATEREGTVEQLKELTTQSKRLRALRQKRDELRNELAETEAQIRWTAEEIGKLTMELADQDTVHTNGKGKSK
jgi:uncharacterized coiled-coil DUF342 family protein